MYNVENVIKINGKTYVVPAEKMKDFQEWMESNSSAIINVNNNIIRVEKNGKSDNDERLLCE